MADVKTVFLSSTGRDLHKHRDAVYQAIEDLDGYHCVRMENFGARDAEADAFCRAKVAACDLFVGIVGHVHGSCPDGSEQSYTEREYDAAVEAERPRLMFIAPEDFPLPAHLIEPDDKRKRQRAFRERVSHARIRDTFTSPDDLARRVVGAIHSWEREQAREAAEPGTASLMPLPPQAYFAHPYPLQENFTGRVRERRMLTEWLTGGDHPVFAFVGIGGMGKSALTWAWLQRDVLGLPLPGQPEDPPEVAEACRVPEAERPEGILWWSFYEARSSCHAFLNAALRYASGGEIDPGAIPSVDEKVRALAGLLERRRLLLVLDGLERQLRAYANLGAAYQGDRVEQDPQQTFRACTDPHAASFLRWLVSVPLEGRVLITSRLFPRELDGMGACRHVELTALDPEDAVAFFYAQGIDGTPGAIRLECGQYGRHPLALRLLAGMIAEDPVHPRHIAAAADYSPIDGLVPREHHILALAYGALSEAKRELLSRVAAFRSPMDYKAVVAISNLADESATKDALRELVARGLLLWDREHARYDLHPIVRQFAYDRLADKQGVHSRLHDYFDAVPQPEKLESVDDLAPVIELYHHTVRAGRFDEAYGLFRARLDTPTYYQFGAYLLQVELLHALFPNGEGKLPRLGSERDEASALNDLACAYSLSGQPRRAVPLFEAANAIDESRGNKKGVAIGLGNVAQDQLKLGELAAAERNLRRRIELCREIGDEAREAIGHQELGRLLAHQGAFDEATSQLRASTAYWERTGDTQGICLDESYRALRALMMGDATAALEAARQALVFWEKDAREDYPVERDFVEAEWLLGAALVALASVETGQQDDLLAEAEGHLTEALTRCRRINLVDLEPDILLAWARWHRAKGNARQAREDAEEALDIADRCEYRLKQADAHNLLARLALDAGDRAGARRHADIAHERALCDGPPHCYQPALDEADRLREEAG